MPTAQNRQVACLLYEGLCSFEYGIAAEVFALPRPEMGKDWYRFTTCAETRRPLRANGGIQVTAETGLAALARAGTVVIPGWRADRAAPSPALRRALWAAHENGARLVTICSGVFLLAAAGLLKGRRVTTHWRYAGQLQAAYPDLAVEPDVLYVDEGDILTSAGSAAGADLLLHIVRKDFGPKAANSVARRLVMPPHRDGDQAQYIEQPVPKRADGQLAPLLDAIRRRPAEGWSVAKMARAAAMSERTFVRRFLELTGSSPGEWICGVRTDAARALLESSRSSLEDIATAVGFGSLGTLRHHFRTRLRTTPADYRRRFRLVSSSQAS
ncbi:MAG TPA: transcriptional regulator FtrA [Gammaproteobacteria bacterium]|jgi:AraC family transcriptional activator FtrA|nr:transcriptional regulator FtrA [Gammaproteobacteria bacterium]